MPYPVLPSDISKERVDALESNISSERQLREEAIAEIRVFVERFASEARVTRREDGGRLPSSEDIMKMPLKTPWTLNFNMSELLPPSPVLDQESLFASIAALKADVVSLKSSSEDFQRQLRTQDTRVVELERMQTTSSRAVSAVPSSLVLALDLAMRELVVAPSTVAVTVAPSTAAGHISTAGMLMTTPAHAAVPTQRLVEAVMHMLEALRHLEGELGLVQSRVAEQRDVHASIPLQQVRALRTAIRADDLPQEARQEVLSTLRMREESLVREVAHVQRETMTHTQTKRVQKGALGKEEAAPRRPADNVTSLQSSVAEMTELARELQ
eukprot:NODE_13604_length_1157_cov_3.521359.p1 GENE.NODE_13604_length_1157_cov_3.521359~~NODE_13604_length_1157_cov_3.521359.p1  ORF type:complete len:327 (+),score=101.66 NODE_13604_length_1157_cov_3.521359:21-1001(+)